MDEEETIEDEDHILLCPSESRSKLHKEWLQEIKTFLYMDHTPEQVRDAIYSSVKGWLDPVSTQTQELEMETQELPAEDFGTAQEAFVQQNVIGWRHYIRGRMSIKWGKCVNDHIKTHDLKGIT